MSLVPGPDEIQVWFRPTASATAAGVQAARSTLSADERARADRFHFDADRRDYVLAHDLLRRCLSNGRSVSPSAWDFGIEAAGKPFLHDAGLSFNLSHTRGLVGCAIGEGAPLGLDVESTNRLLDMESIAGCFSPGETAALDRCDDDTRRLRLLELWTLKESFVKALGTGLAMPLDSMSFELDRQGSIVFEPPPGVAAREWHFALFEPAPDARMAVAVRAPHPPVVIARGVSPTDVDVTSIPLPPMRLTATLTTRPPATGGSPRTI